MPGKRFSPFWAILSVFILCICGSILFFYCLGERDLWGSHEARAAQNSQRILSDGDWLQPRLFDDRLELQKPPMYYWLAAACGWVCNGQVDAFTVRLPAALAGSATVLAVVGFLARRGRFVAGLGAAIVLLTAQHFVWVARTARIDIPLTFAVTGSVLCLWMATQFPSDRLTSLSYSWVGYLLIALGIMLKGPLGAILPFAILTVIAVAERRSVMPSSVAWGLPLILAVAAPWFVVAHLRSDGEFTRVFFWYHHIQRATGATVALASHPWWFYGPRFFVDFLPAGVLIPVAAWMTFRRPDARADREARLGIVWLVTVVLILSASRFKRADYLLPGYPGAAIWIGCVGERVFQSWRSSHRGKWLLAGSVGILATTVVVWGVFLQTVVPRMDAEREKRTFAAAIRQAVPSPELVLLFRVEDHLLAYHLRRPLNTFLEWENLDVWAGRAGTHHILMPAECAAVWRQYITSGELDEVLRFTDRTDRHRPRNLVLMRTRPRAAGNPMRFTDARAERSPARQ